MKLSMDKVADALNLSVSTLARWIRQGRIPVQRSGNDVLFSPAALEKWAHEHNLPFALQQDRANADKETVTVSADSLVSAMQRGEIRYGVAGNDPESVLRSAIGQMSCFPEIDKEELLEKLIAREQLASTGIGNGIAIPHPRDPLSRPPEAPVIITCFLETPIDYNAIDDKPVFVLFLLINPTIKLHLQVLSRLSYCIRNREFVDFLATQPEEADLFSRIVTLEDNLDD